MFIPVELPDPFYPESQQKEEPFLSQSVCWIVYNQ